MKPLVWNLLTIFFVVIGVKPQFWNLSIVFFLGHWDQTTILKFVNCIFGDLKFVQISLKFVKFLWNLYKFQRNLSNFREICTNFREICSDFFCPQNGLTDFRFVVLAEFLSQDKCQNQVAHWVHTNETLDFQHCDLQTEVRDNEWFNLLASAKHWAKCPSMYLQSKPC